MIVASLSGIIFINRNGLRWRNGEGMNVTGPRERPNREYGHHKTLYNRWKTWSDMGVFARIMTGLAADPVLHDSRAG